MTMQGPLVITKALFLNLNNYFSFLNRISLHIISSRYQLPDCPYQTEWTLQIMGAQITLLKGNASVPQPLLCCNEAPPTCSVVNYVLHPCTLIACKCTPSAIGATVSASLCSEHVILTQQATVVGEVTSPSRDTMCHFCAPVLYTDVYLPATTSTWIVCFLKNAKTPCRMRAVLSNMHQVINQWTKEYVTNFLYKQFFNHFAGQWKNNQALV